MFKLRNKKQELEFISCFEEGLCKSENREYIKEKRKFKSRTSSATNEDVQKYIDRFLTPIKEEKYIYNEIENNTICDDDEDDYQDLHMRKISDQYYLDKVGDFDSYLFVGTDCTDYYE